MLKDFVKLCAPLPPNSKMLILGGGFSGQHIAALSRMLEVNTICSRRNIDKFGADCVFDSKNGHLPTNKDLAKVTHLISCIPPDANGNDPVLNSLKKQLLDLPLQWVGYLSTTGVYGNCNGEWVSESNPAKPEQLRSQRRLCCEQAWQASGLPVQILRLPGIYGPGRSAIKTVKRGQAKMIEKKGQVFSRIHIDDIAGSVFHLIDLASKGKKPKIVNVADNLPASNIDVLRYAASLTGISLPANEPYETAKENMTPMALSFWQENRKVSNRMLCQELGYSLIQPNYQIGLKDCLLQEK